MKTASKTLGSKAPQALWSAAACCRFRAGQLAGRALERVTLNGEARAGSLEKSGSKLPHSIAIPLILAGLLFLSGCGQHGADSGASSVPFGSAPGEEAKAQLFTVPAEQMAHVEVTPVEVTRLPRVLRLTGSVAYNNFKTTPVITQVSGPVSRILVSPGEVVHTD